MGKPFKKLVTTNQGHGSGYALLGNKFSIFLEWITIVTYTKYPTIKVEKSTKVMHKTHQVEL